MRARKHLKKRYLVAGILGVFALAAWVLMAGSGTPNLSGTGGPRLVAVSPLPVISMDGAICQLQPASAGETLFAALMQAPAGGAADPRESLARVPVRVIKDPYPTYSAVAVDTKHGEIVLQDENLFQIMAYDRTTNTPASAAMSEPKRVIGGHQTKMEFNCGIYVDPETGDIYSINNDTLDTMTVFNREAKGNVPPTRELETQHGTFGIAVDEGAKELFMTVQHGNSLLVYNKYAEGDDKPLRMIVGNKTKLADPHGVGIDTKNGWAFVANYGNNSQYLPGEERKGGGATGGQGRIAGSGKFFPPSITAYPIKGDGDLAPLRTIQGPKTQINWPAHITVDSDTGLIYVANDGGDSILVFKVTDDGDVAPTRVLKGPKTQIKNPTGVNIDKTNKELLVANMGNHRATVYPLNANGDVAPLRVIRAAPANEPALQIGNPGAVAYDTKRDAILVPN